MPRRSKSYRHSPARRAASNETAQEMNVDTTRRRWFR